MKLSVLILNFRTPELAVDCIRSLDAERSGPIDFRVELLDNASGDHSAEFLEKAVRANNWAAWVDFEAGEKNLGFAGGNNHLIRKVLRQDPVPEYLLLLNSDTIVHPGCLKAAVRAFEKNSRTGAMSVMLRNADGSIQNVCRRLPSPLRMSAHALGLPWTFPRLFGWADLEDPGWDRETTARKVGWVGGAFLLTRSDLVRKIGGLDQDFFFYGEDIEFSHRVARSGHEVRFDPSGSITHLGGASSDSSRLLDERKVRLEWQARLLVQRKCYGKWAEAWMRSLNRAILAWRWRRQRKNPETDDALATVRARKILRDPWNGKKDQS